MKVIEITGCNTCPHRSGNPSFTKEFKTSSGGIFYCNNAAAWNINQTAAEGFEATFLREYPSIPVWCPLPDKKEL